MNVVDLRKKNEKDLHEFVAEQRENLLKITREKRTSEQTNVHETRSIKKDIARALTVINEQRLAREAESKEK